MVQSNCIVCGTVIELTEEEAANCVQVVEECPNSENHA